MKYQKANCYAVLLVNPNKWSIFMRNKEAYVDDFIGSNDAIRRFTLDPCFNIHPWGLTY